MVRCENFQVVDRMSESGQEDFSLMETGLKIHEIIKEVGIWIVCGVTSFLAYNVWQLTISMERVSINIEYIVKNASEFDEDLAKAQIQLNSLYAQQLKNTEAIYSLSDINRRLGAVEADTLSVKNIRWNIPDMQRWVEEMKELNPSLKFPITRNSKTVDVLEK